MTIDRVRLSIVVLNYNRLEDTRLTMGHPQAIVGHRKDVEVIAVDDEDAFEWGRNLAKREGIMAGISSGANMWAAAQVAARPEFRGKRIVTIMCSLGERYLSTKLFPE